MLAGTDGQQLIVWDVADGRGRQLSNPYPPPGDVTAVHLAADPGGGLLAVAYDNGRVAMWDVVGGRRLAVSLEVPVPVTGMEFSRDGARIVTSGPAVTTWNIDPEHWAEWACEVTQRNLSEQEWQTYGVGPRMRVCAQWPLD
jgi:hypothetical protein